MEDKMTFDQWLESDHELRAEFDRRTGKGIETARANWEKEAQERIRNSAMSAEERMREELQAANQRAEALEQEKNRMLMQQAAAQMLAERRLPATFAEYLAAADEADTQMRVEAFAAAFNQAVTEAVSSRFPRQAPAAGEGEDMFLRGFGR